MRALKIFGLATLALLLSNCDQVQSTIPSPLTFTRYQPIILDVGDVQIIEEYQSPKTAPYVEHLMPYSPAEAMRIWVKDRIRASGNEKSLQVIIKDARVMSSTLPSGSGVLGVVGLSKDKRYDLTLAVEMRIYGRSAAMSEANVNVSTTRFITIADTASSHEREVQFRKMVGDSMEVINAELEKNIFTYFGHYITYQ
ncbi:MAG: hypothetical protein EBR02_04765 [Alphaproteobacteria bacterium]|nr:hypothetical protein [Alphaproteobacteria bacterium]